MTIDWTTSTAAVTGANRGLGAALTRALLDAGCRRIYAAVREPLSWPISDMRTLPTDRVAAVGLDITDPDDLHRVRDIGDVDVLINNAGVVAFGDVLDPDALSYNMAVNFDGTLNATRALAPRRAVVNVMTSWAVDNPGGPMGAYAASKAALHSATQALRADRPDLLVVGVYAGAIDTDMTRGLNIPKAAPDVVAKRIVDGVAAGHTDIAP